MTGKSTRRRWLTLCGIGLSVGLAGCSSDEAGDDSGPLSDMGSDQRDDGGSQDENGGESNGGSGEGASGDGTSGGGDDGDGTSEGGNDGDSGTDSEPGTATLSETINWEPSYIVEISFSGDRSGTVTQTVHEGDIHIVADFGSLQGESYTVDGEKYEIVGGQCIVRSDSQIENQSPDVGDPSGSAPEIEATETTTTDGEPVYVFEMPSQEDGRWYVSRNTGYPVRFEIESFTARFHSWGETDPISPPDMNCREV